MILRIRRRISTQDRAWQESGHVRRSSEEKRQGMRHGPTDGAIDVGFGKGHRG
jgi:hypothetical protein